MCKMEWALSESFSVSNSIKRGRGGGGILSSKLFNNYVDVIICIVPMI